jgi:hypothetical protein
VKKMFKVDNTVIPAGIGGFLEGNITERIRLI